MNIEHSRTSASSTGSLNVVATKSSLMKPKKEKFKAVPTSQKFWNVVPTKGCPPSKAIQTSLLVLMSNSEIQRLIE
jgi:hypothetical protein